MSDHDLLTLLNELRKRDKMRGLPSIYLFFRNEFDNVNNTRARMLVFHRMSLKMFCFHCTYFFLLISRLRI